MVPPTTHSYTLSLPDALPISGSGVVRARKQVVWFRHRSAYGPTGGPLQEALCMRVLAESLLKRAAGGAVRTSMPDRKSTRLNSSHSQKSYAVFCLKKKKKHNE